MYRNDGGGGGGKPRGTPFTWLKLRTASGLAARTTWTRRRVRGLEVDGLARRVESRPWVAVSVQMESPETQCARGGEVIIEPVECQSWRPGSTTSRRSPRDSGWPSPRYNRIWGCSAPNPGTDRVHGRVRLRDPTECRDPPDQLVEGRAGGGAAEDVTIGLSGRERRNSPSSRKFARQCTAVL